MSERQKVRFVAQEHLGTGIYHGDFDTIIDLARKRAGDGVIFTVTSTGDDRLATDKRYEKLIDSHQRQKHSKYGTVNIDDRGVLVLDRADNHVATAYNSVEYETRDGHLLAFGIPRDLIGVRTGSKVTFEKQLDRISPYCPINLIGHPTFIGGLGNKVKEIIENGNTRCLELINGVAVYSGTANMVPFAFNGPAIRFFREHIAPHFLPIAPYLEGDGHSLSEFARVSTSVPSPEVVWDGGTIDAKATFDNLRKSILSLAHEDLDTILKRDKPSLLTQTVGCVGAWRHAFDLKFLHSRRLKREERLNK